MTREQTQERLFNFINPSAEAKRPELLNFDNDWNQLMLAKFKINTIPLESEKSLELMSMISMAIDDVDIESAYKYIITFVEQYENGSLQ